MTKQILIRKQLYNAYKHIRAVCLNKGKRYEGVPLQKEWATFEGFYTDNLLRFKKAQYKWKNYKKVSIYYLRELKINNRKRKYVLSNICLARKVKQLGYTKNNTVFTSLSDKEKYDKKSHKYLFGKNLLGTRDVQNIIKKNGLKRSISNIQKRKRKEKNPFGLNTAHRFEWKGKFMNLREISEKEKISKNTLKMNMYNNNMSLEDAVKKTKKFKGTNNKDNQIILSYIDYTNVLNLVKNGNSISKSLRALKIPNKTFYKFITIEQRLELRLNNKHKSRVYNQNPIT
jgi:hypothetical protein